MEGRSIPGVPTAAPPPPGSPLPLRGGRLLPWLLLLLGLALTGWGWLLAREEARNAAREQFEFRLLEIRAAIDDRLGAYAQLLRGGVGLFAASQEVTREEWRRYVVSVNPLGRVPGIQGVGFAVVVPPGERRALEERMRRQGYPEFTVFPHGEREIYTSILFLEPADWRNRRAIGYDMFSEPVRRAAMERARDTGLPSASGKIVLVQETRTDVQPGFLIYLPVYRGGDDPGSPQARREALLGYVYAPFRMHDFAVSVLGPLGSRGVEIELFDGESPGAESLLYDSDPGSLLAGEGRSPLFVRGFTYELYGHHWTARFASLPALEAGIDRLTPRLTAAAGSVISLLLFAVTWSLARTEARASAMAEAMTAVSRERTAQLREITSALGEGVYVADGAGRITFVNPAASLLVGWSEQELLGAPAHDLFHQHGDDPLSLARCPFLRATGAGRSYTADDESFRRKGGQLLPVSVVATPILREGVVAGAVVAFHDLSERKQAEAILRESERFRLLFEYSREALLLLDRDGRLADVNRLACESLGYSRGELIGERADQLAVAPGGSPIGRLLTGSEAGESVRLEAQLRRRDGSQFPVEMVASPIEHGARKLLLVSVRDISERRRAEAEQQRLMAALERAKGETERVNNELERTNAELKRLSQVDPLTGVANRRYFDQRLEVEWARALRDRDPLSLILLDVDFFKNYNDHFGHQAGDECLRRIAAVLEERLGRPSDLLARYGGEEFVVVLPQTHSPGALHIAENLRAAVEGLRLPHPRSEAAEQVTISLGVATAEPAADLSPARLLQAADEALYQVKRAGRNRVLFQAVR